MTAQPPLDEFLAGAKTFLDVHADPLDRDRESPHPQRIALFASLSPDEEARLVAEARRWREQLWQAGLAWITGPVEYGGRGLPAAYERAFHALERGYRTPSKQPFLVALGMVAPTILAHGPEAMRARHLPAIYRGRASPVSSSASPGPARTWRRSPARRDPTATTGS